jgi:hypothetical protein
LCIFLIFIREVFEAQVPDIFCISRIGVEKEYSQGEVSTAGGQPTYPVFLKESSKWPILMKK